MLGRNCELLKSSNVPFGRKLPPNVGRPEISQTLRDMKESVKLGGANPEAVLVTSYVNCLHSGHEVAETAFDLIDLLGSNGSEKRQAYASGKVIPIIQCILRDCYAP